VTVFGVDYAFSNPSPVGLFAAGKRFAMRYVGPGSAPKHLTAAERDKIWAAGLDIVLLAEGNTSDALQGHALGVAHARSARAAATALGAPRAQPIYYAVDFQVTAAQWPKVRDYLQGAAAADGGVDQVGVYGSYNAMAWASHDGAAAWFFQTYAWSGGKWFAGNDVEQYRNGVALAGGDVDLCRAKVPNYGQWVRPGVPGPPSTSGGTDVELKDRVALPAAAYPELKGQTSAQVSDILAYDFARLVRIEAAVAALGARAATDLDTVRADIAAVLAAEHNDPGTGTVIMEADRQRIAAAVVDLLAARVAT